MSLAIECRKISKSFGKITAVSELDLAIEKGELYALLGTNGAGKSTTVRILSGLLGCDSGSFDILGLGAEREMHKIKEKIAVSPQETAVAGNLSVRENLELMAGLFGMRGDALRQRVDGMIEAFSLSEVERRRAAKLSGGWQRRLSIAMAMISDPEIIFLDEPTLGLDVIARRELWETIRGMKGKKTVILTTHYMEEAEALSDRIGIMKDGRLIAEGSAEELTRLSGEPRFEDAFVKIVTGEVSRK